MNKVAKSDVYGEQSLLEKDDTSFFVFKKAERIASALYLVSDLISPDEPLQSHLREMSLGLLHRAARLGNADTVRADARSVSSILAEIGGLLSLGVIAGYISPMNRELVSRECDRVLMVLKQMEEVKGGESRTIALSQDFFGGSLGGSSKFENGREVKTYGIDVWSELQKRHELDRMDGYIGHNDDIMLNRQFKKSLMSNSQISSINKDSRRTKILDIVKRKGRVNIKDISAVIANCSEKTIQRELIALVDEGVLKKEGERRWSTYVLAS